MKRFLAMVLVICIFFSMQPAFAYAESAPEKEENTEKRTVEEILDEYHRKSLEAAFSAEKNAGTSSRAATSGKTLEQETVEELNAAGYEAYNVTSDNYESLEKTLKTDFSSMGLDPNGSYIITISGDEENAPNNSNSRGGPNIEEVGGPGFGGDGYEVFLHTYNGTTYSMRYVTVTAADNSDLYQWTEIDLLDKYGLDDLVEDLNVPITILTSVKEMPKLEIIYALIAASVPDYNVNTQNMEYEGRTNWTLKCVQVYDLYRDVWEYTASTEYVTMTYSIYHSYYDPVKDKGVSVTTSGDYDMVKSANYDNTTYIKNQAAYAYENGLIWKDMVLYVTYKFDEEMVIRHYRRG